MSASLAPLVLLAQGGPTPLPAWMVGPLQWLWVFGDPSITVPNPTGALSWVPLGGLITWLKVIGLLSLLGWIASRVLKAQKERGAATLDAWSIAALVGLVGLMGVAMLQVLESTGRVKMFRVGAIPVGVILSASCLLLILAWVERSLWSTLGRIGHRTDRLVLVGIHLAFALGMLAAFGLLRLGVMVSSWQQAVVYGARLGGTYMGYVVLAQLLCILLVEVAAVRGRRLYAIGQHSVVEANRRMWAPYVVVAVFLVILAFTHWFLVAPRAAEMGRLYVGTLSLLCSLLLTVMITILAPISLPHDIRMQTIYTIVTKPVRRIELIWGRILGFMAIVTVLLAVFGGISLLYLWRTVGGTIDQTKALAAKYDSQGLAYEAKMARDQADQLETRMTARVQHKGLLAFVDSLGKPQYKGIDVGQELEKRSFVEGATPSAAIWSFGVMRDPLDAKLVLDRRVPVARFLRDGSLESAEDRMFRLRSQADQADAAKSKAGQAGQEVARLGAEADAARAGSKSAEAEANSLRDRSEALKAKAAAAEKAGNAAGAVSARREEARLHSPGVPLEMTFTVYRTTKGIIGDPVFASIEAVNPRNGRKFKEIFPIREYYTNKVALPSSLLAGSLGALNIEVRCLSPTQYLGMAESDLYLVSRSDNFGLNFMKGLFGVWVQAMVLTAIGVFAGTFLSWPVALLLTIAFFIAGQVAFSFLQQFAMQTLQASGGGPFESLIRLLSHENLVNDLTPTMAVVTAKTADSLVMPVMSRLVYVVPNFSAFDVSNTVAEGYAVGWDVIAANLLLGLAYALPFSIAGYFILKNREVAA